jgi:predicted phage terminase large subunit-like protein
MRKPTEADVRHARKIIASRRLAEFAIYTDSRYKMNWHHELLCEYLDRFAAKEIRRLMVFMPPRHGKSELVSRKLPAFIFGRYPDVAIIATSYTSDLAQRMNRDVQHIIDSPAYKELFPDTSLFGKNIRTVANGSYLRNSDIFEIVNHRGTYRGAGVCGGITGMGGDYIIIDDPVKSREDANSLTMRDKLWEWFAGTLYTRQEKNAAILITLTRWHEDDLAGRLLEMAKTTPGADQWDVLNLPALCEEGLRHPRDIREDNVPLWEDKFNYSDLMSIKSTIGAYEWSAQYQQRPSPEGGGVFKEAWLRWYNPSALEVEMKAQGRGFDLMIQSWDMTFKDADSGDYVVGQVWARRGGDFYLIDQVRDKLNFTDSVAAVKMMSSKYPQAMTKLVEDKANGPAIIEHLKHEIFGLHPVQPDGSKESRAQAVTPLFESGNVYLPDPSACPWVQDFKSELLTFPSAKHDDQVDAMAYALRHLALGVGNVAERLLAYGIPPARRQSRDKRRRVVR